MKKIALIFASLLGLLLIAIIVIPLVVDVDQYRPKIVEAANQRLNGKLSLGKLKLKLWGRIQIDAESFELLDAKGRRVVAVKDAFFHLPYTSILSGSPLVTLAMDAPEVRIVKDANGKMNVLTLLKDSPADSAKPTDTPAEAAGDPAKIPSVVSNARIGVELKDAAVHYQDEVTKNVTTMKNLNLRVKDLSLSRKTEVELAGQFESAQEETFKIAGPFKIDATIDPKMVAGKLTGLGMDLNADFSDLDIQAGGMFHKKKGVTTKLSGKMDSMDDGMRIEKFVVNFFNAEVSARGLVKAMSTEKPEIDVSITSNEIDLKPWNELIPMLNEYELSGKAKLSAFAKGPSTELQYGADFSIQDLKAKAPLLKSQPVVNAEIRIVTDKVEKILATVTAPGNDLTLSGSVVSFTTPKVDLKLTSNSLDLDQLIDLPAPEEKAPTKSAGAGKTAGKTASAPAGDENLDRLLDPIRKNPIAAATTLLAQANLKLIKFYDVRMTDTQAKLSLKNLVASVDQFSTHVFDGAIGAKMDVAMKPTIPTYHFNANVAGFDLQKAVSSKLALFKNTLLGKVNLKMSGNGASLNTEPAKRNLNAKGSFSVLDGKFASIDISKVTTEAVNKGLAMVGDKIPGLKGKTLKPFEKEARYDVISADFSINGGIFTMPNFVAKAEKDTGLDLKGSTTVGLIDQELKADWEIIDTYNLTKARDVSVDIDRISIPSILAEGSNPVTLPVTVGCKYTAPCPSYGRVPEHFAKIALRNTKTGATAAAKEVVKEKAQEKAKEVGKKLLKGLFN